jgi:predicted nucleic acid-binding protein
MNLSLVDSYTEEKFIDFFPKTKQCQHTEELMQKYRDLPMDLADASLVILAEELGSGQILSVDYRDVNTYRWKNTEPFQIKLAEISYQEWLKNQGE